MNPGLLQGLRKGGWQNYVPILRTVKVGGGSTQPGASDNFGSQHAGRWLQLDNGLVIAQIQVYFPLGLARGSGDAYLVRLPKMANRWANLNGMAIGTGMAYQALADPSEHMPITPQLCERDTFVEVSGQEDHWCQMQVPYHVASGTGTIPAGSSPGTNSIVTITHGIGITPKASDIVITPTVLPNANVHVVPSVQNITSTTFDVALRAVVGTPTDFTFGWRVWAEPSGSIVNALVSPLKPWNWFSFYLLMLQLYYEAR